MLVILQFEQNINLRIIIIQNVLILSLKYCQNCILREKYKFITVHISQYIRIYN